VVPKVNKTFLSQQIPGKVTPLWKHASHSTSAQTRAVHPASFANKASCS